DALGETAPAAAEPACSDAPPRGAVDLAATVRANLRGWSPTRRALAIERLKRRSRPRPAVEATLLVDVSGSMAEAALDGVLIAGAAAQSGRWGGEDGGEGPRLAPRLVLFDHRVLELSERDDPITQLLDAATGAGARVGGGGTDLPGALRRAAAAPGPAILISDLRHDGSERALSEALTPLAGRIAAIAPSLSPPPESALAAFAAIGAPTQRLDPGGSASDLARAFVASLRRIGRPSRSGPVATGALAQGGRGAHL
ncbi:MAG: VWA domain-containing protein, partial [Pseudomonadota bacterium]